MNVKACLSLAAMLCLLAAAVSASAQLKQYKDLRNAYIKVIDVREQDKTEEKYLETDGKLELTELVRKTLRITAEIIAKPPPTMDNMFNDEQAVPYFKVCLTAFNGEAKLGDEDCKAFKFNKWVRGDIGVAVFNLPEGLTRYDLRVIKDVPNKGEGFKLWVPTN